MLRARTFAPFAAAVAFSAAIAVAAPTAAPAASASAHAIRKVDFKNFTYDHLDFDDGPVTVTNGKFTRDDNDGQLYVNVSDVDHGDIDGDGIDEAVVTIGSSTGGTGFFTDARVFKLVGGQPKEITSDGVGDRADGGIDNVVIINGVLRIDRYGSIDGGACCPQLIVRESLKLRNGKLVRVAPDYKRKLISLGFNPDGSTGPSKISFFKGTSEAAIDGGGDTSGYFDAGKGQKVTLTTAMSYGKQLVVKISGPGMAPITLTPPATWSTSLPATGRYTITVPGNGDESNVRMNLSIR